MRIRRFRCLETLEEEAAQLLRSSLSLARAEPYAVMLTGGKTPLGVYARLAASPPSPSPLLRIFLSDERHVPRDASESNFAQIVPLLRALALDDDRVFRVLTELPLEEAADRYHRELTSFLDRGGSMPLGILGLGADGHVASLFDEADLERGKDRAAIAVARPSGPDRISVTRTFLLRVERLVFLVVGAEKEPIVERISRSPETVVAGRALEGAADVELWFAR